MRTRRFVHRSRLPISAEDAFRWHARPGAFERLTPPWESVRVEEKDGGIENGARVVLRMGSGPLAVRWVAEHCDYVEGRQFRDVQVSGPFALWRHTHRVTPAAQAACELEDEIEYALPFAPFGDLVAGGFTRRRLERMFRYRHRVTEHDLVAHGRFKGEARMKIAITGSNGLIGKALGAFLSTGGHDVARLVRKQGRLASDEIRWDPAAGKIDAAALQGIDAVVHLAGESVAARWTAAKKAAIRDSRVEGTRLLSATLAELTRPPKALVAASAIGYYGDRGATPLEEDAAPGAGFLAEVCREWEAASEAAQVAGIRVAHMRIGVVLSPSGGALASMLPPFRLGLGGVVGSGEQYMSWIALDDVVGALHHALMAKELSGPVNTVAPNPVTNQLFTKTLGGVLSRPTLIPMPAFAVRLAFGQMGEELLLSSTRVLPARLAASGYEFRFPQLEGALQHLLGR
jgi:uncharacterized protein (TIGR01777 family)